jgi:hypothetical protein
MREGEMTFANGCFAVVLLAAFCGGAEAAEPVPPFSNADPSCACVAQGKRFAQGEVACISGVRMVCGMNQNISAWLSQGEACQVSSLRASDGQLTVQKML